MAVAVPRELDQLGAPSPPSLLVSDPGGTPAQQLTGLMWQCRRAGLDFDRAWTASLRVIHWPASERETAEWRKMLGETREGWRAAYDRWPQLPSEMAVSQLWDLVSRARDAA